MNLDSVSFNDKGLTSIEASEKLKNEGHNTPPSSKPKNFLAIAFTTLIVSNIAVILTNRSWTDNIFKIIATPNKAVLWVVGGAVFFMILILNLPFFLDLFQFQRLTFTEIMICNLSGLFTIVWFEIYKLIKLRRNIPL